MMAIVEADENARNIEIDFMLASSTGASTISCESIREAIAGEK